jgi:2-oxoglutarate ferredoxin oxidoreductase subunit beta
MTVMLHDNQIYGLTKKQTSPTSPRGLVTNTSPKGAELQPLNPLAVTLGMPNISFVAQTVDWLPGVLYDVIRAGFQHRGLSFISIMQRCPNFLPEHFEGHIRDPARVLLLTHARGLRPDQALLRRFVNRVEHDPLDLNRARELADTPGKIPVGILYQNPNVPCYEDLHVGNERTSIDARIAVLEEEFAKFMVTGA